MNFLDILQQLLNLFTSKGDVPNPIVPSTELKTIVLLRTDTSTAGIFGTISLTWDSWVGVSLENVALSIPVGIYSLEWHVSPHLNNATVPMLIGVPGRTEILLHWGNTESCSEGCILCGLVRDGDSIDTTQEACKELFAKINEVGIENVQIQIS